MVVGEIAYLQMPVTEVCGVLTYTMLGTGPGIFIILKYQVIMMFMPIYLTLRLVRPCSLLRIDQ